MVLGACLEKVGYDRRHNSGSNQHLWVFLLTVRVALAADSGERPGDYKERLVDCRESSVDIRKD